MQLFDCLKLDGDDARALLEDAERADHLAEELMRMRGNLEERVAVYCRSSAECRQSQHNAKSDSGHAMMKARAELYEIIARELAEILKPETVAN